MVKNDKTPEEIAALAVKVKESKDFLEKVNASNVALVDGNKVMTPAVVSSLREVGNRLTSQIQSRTVDGHLISNTVVSTVQEIDEDFAINERKLQLDIARCRRKLDGNLRAKCDTLEYNKFYNYHASPLVKGRAFTLQEVINRFNSGVPTDTNDNNVSYDTDQPFIDFDNYYRLGGIKYKDIAQVPTAYQKKYSSTT